MRVEDLGFDRTKVLAWWTGRITNAELAAWSGQTERDVRLILDTPFMRSQIQSGGRGSKHTRRISPQARNAVAIVGALRKGGLTIEAAVNLLGAAPVLADIPTQTIDFSPSVLEALPANYGTVIALAMADPEGGWLPSDIVPRHVFDRRCRPIVKKGTPDEFSMGDLGWLPTWFEERIGGLPPGWRAVGEPLYRPEIDPVGVYEFGNSLPDNLDATDYYIHIFDGRWVFVREQDPSPREYAVDLFQMAELNIPRRFTPSDVKLSTWPIAEIERRSGAARFIRGDENAVAVMGSVERQFQTKLTVNASLAIRQMKRRALGLIPLPDTS